MTAYSRFLNNLEYAGFLFKVAWRPVRPWLTDGPLWLLVAISLTTVAFSCGASSVQPVAPATNLSAYNSESDIVVRGPGWERWRVDLSAMEDCHLAYNCRRLSPGTAVKAVWRDD